MNLIGIAAVGEHNQIGLEGKLPWKNKEEMRHFKNTTRGHVVIMGRKTYESIPNGLPNRKVIVISSYKAPQAGYKNVFFVRRIENAYHLANFVKTVDQNVYIAGGEQIYDYFLPHMNEILISQMQYTGKAHTYFPHYEDDFAMVKMELIRSDDGDFEIQNWERKR
jgi:dihydrofolate reductase